MSHKPKGERSRTSEVFGVNPVLEALRAKRRAIREITIASGTKDSRLAQLIEMARAEHVPVHYAPRQQLDRATGNAVHQGVVARIAAAEYTDADELLESIDQLARNETPPLVVVLDGVEDPHNLGAILRTAECAGVNGVFVPERRAAGLTDTVGKASAGAIEYVPVARAVNLSRLIDQLKERNVWVVGTAADASMDYTGWDWTRPSAIVMGSEGSGLHRLVREHCDALVRIPVRGQIKSLNVSVATGIIVYEALRQRTVQIKNLQHG